MKGKQIVAIDVGSTNVTIAVGAVEEDGRVDILGIVAKPIEGVNAGRLENSDTAGRAILAAKESIEQKLGIKITEAYAGLSGDYVRCVQVTDHVYVQDELGNGSNQITERDLRDLDQRMKSVKLPDDREEIMTIEPLRYKIDDKEVDIPVGAYGHVLSATYNFVLTDKTMRERMRQCLLRQGIKVKEFCPNALISHLAVATTEDVDDGAVIIDLGGGITDVTVLTGGKVRHMASIPIGVDILNSDIRAYGIPANYVEPLKIKHGSAVTELTKDDKIAFSSPRKGTAKSILRRNLATIIESRLKEMAEWVRNEIKEAGCGTRFSPVVLLTGGGAQMQNIETLFSRELGYDDVRVVYPEYGFTDEMAQHITTPAYATVASLLVYGAKRGSCSVAVRPESISTGNDYESRFERTTAERPVTEQKTPQPEEHKRATPTITPVTPATDDIDDADFVLEGGHKEAGLLGWMRKKFTGMKESFTGEDEANL